MIINLKEVRFENEAEEKRVKEILNKMNNILSKNKDYKPCSIDLFKNYLLEYANWKKKDDKGVILENALKYVALAIYMDQSKNYMLIHKINLIDAYDDIIANNSDNVYKKYFAEAFAAMDALYNSIAGRDVSEDFYNINTSDIASRAERISIFKNESNVLNIFNQPTKNFYSKSKSEKLDMFNKIARDLDRTLTDLNVEGRKYERNQKVYDEKSRETEINGLYNIALKYRALKECQSEWWIPFRFVRPNWYTFHRTLKDLKSKISHCKIQYITKQDGRIKDYIKYINGKNDINFLQNFEIELYGAYNLKKLHPFVSNQLAREEKEQALIEKLTKEKQEREPRKNIHIHEVNKVKELSEEFDIDENNLRLNQSAEFDSNLELKNERDSK
jgi:hypothetical protein